MTSFSPYALLLLGIIAIALMPLFGAIAASAIGSAAGCRVDEAGSYPCIVFGSDIGGMLSVLFVMGWLMFVTLPIGALLIVVWAVAVAIHFFRRRSGQR